MNERIRELDLRAWTYAREKCPDYHGVTTAFSEMFAELIIMECAVIANKAENNDTEIRCMYDVITEYFGVE